MPKRARRRKLETAKAELEPPTENFGGQGAHREVGSEGHEENHRVVIEGSDPEDEPVGQRWGMVEPALWGRRRIWFHPIAPRCVRATRWRRDASDPGRPGIVRAEGKVEMMWHPQTKGRATEKTNIDLEPRKVGADISESEIPADAVPGIGSGNSACLAARVSGGLKSRSARGHGSISNKWG